MWLRNWYSILNAIFLSRTDDNIPAENPSDSPAIACRLTGGSWYKISNQLSRDGAMSASDLIPGKFELRLGAEQHAAQAYFYTLLFGTGTTPPTINDYRIETPITTGLSMASGTTTLVNKTALSNGRYSYKTRAAVNNTSNANITISEIALNAPLEVIRGTTSGATACVYRDVLLSPITLEPGDTVLIEFEWDAPIYAAPTP